MPTVNFKNKTLTLDKSVEHDKEAAIFLAFSKANADHQTYEAIYKAMPRIHGLRRKRNRAAYAFDLVESLRKAGYDIVKQTKENE